MPDNFEGPPNSNDSLAVGPVPGPMDENPKHWYRDNPKLEPRETFPTRPIRGRFRLGAKDKDPPAVPDPKDLIGWQ